MTTLPTTTPMRLPRPVGQAPLALPTPGGGQQQPSFQMTGGDVWRVIRSNLWVILISLVVSAGLGVGLNKYLSRYHSSYTAVGFCQVTPPFNFSLLDRNTPVTMDIQSLAVDQKTQANLLQNEALFVQVLQNDNSEVRKTTWFQSFDLDPIRAKDNLKRRFDVDVIPESKLISVRMSYSNPRDCKVIVEEIVNTHLENQKKINQNKQLERSVMLNNLKQRYQFRRDELGRDLREKAVQLSVDGMGTPGRLSAKEVELQDLLKNQFEIQRNRDDAGTAYKSAVDQLNDGQDLPGAQEEIARDNEVQSLRAQVNNLDYQLGAISDLGPQHRQRLNLQRMRDDIQRKLEDAQAAVRARANAGMVEKLRQMRDATEGQLKAIQERVDNAKQDLGSLTNAMNQYLTIKDDELTTRELLKQVNDQLEQISQMGNADISTIQWATHPETPDTPSFPKLLYVVSGCVALGLLLSLGIAFLRELLDTSVRSPRDIARVGQLNLLGIIPHEDDDPQAAGAPLPTVIFQAPHSMLAEQFRQVRSRLQHAASLDSTRSLMVTSPSPGDGKSTVACNLAAGLALNGRRILLVDANFRRPELHKIFGLPNDAGFSAVLNSIDQFASAVCQTQVPNLDILPSGPRPSNATELLESQLLIDVIERALEEYDHVIFDSGPFLFVSESVALAPRVDGVVTVVRARSNSRGLLQRLRDDLRKTKAEHLGVVLNAVRAQAGGYYNRNIKTYYAYQNAGE
ncbi:MAG TPA: polysaccharide biosynthesis tyrosine autokinase [Tepidisphaeraceae bacterium]|nr:polysaccharide biosynthesis tyrosine autokinase [Tepidisphaeraceae bacterium]